MKKIGREPGLVRYTSLNELNGGKTKFLRARTIFYTFLAIAGSSLFAWHASHIEPMFANVTRQASGSAFILFNGTIRNQFIVRVIDKRNEASTYKITVEGDVPKELQIAGNETPFRLHAQGEELKSLVFTLPESAYSHPMKMVIRVTEIATGKSVTTMPIEFVGPDPRSKNHEYLDASKYLQK